MRKTRFPTRLSPLSLICVSAVMLAGCASQPFDPADRSQVAVPTSSSPTAESTPIQPISVVSQLPALAAPSVALTSVKPSATKAGATPSAKKATKAAQALKASALDPRCTTVSKALCADKSQGKLHYVVNGQIERTFAARFGRSTHPTNEGQFKVYYKNPKAISKRYNDAEMPWAMFFNGHEGVHYSSAFKANTNPRGSHGCINLKDFAGAKWLYGQVPNGTRVVVYRSKNLPDAAPAVAVPAPSAPASGATTKAPTTQPSTQAPSATATSATPTSAAPTTTSPAASAAAPSASAT